MPKLSLLFFTLLSLLILFSLHASAEVNSSESPEDTAARVQLRIDKMQSLSFNFHQQTKGEMTGRPRRGSGKAVFFKNDNSSRMRWDYTSPDKQILVSDGVVFSMYFDNLKQMIVSPAENLNKDLTYSFFTGRGNLKRDFHILPPDEETGSNTEEFQIIKLIPKQPHSQVQDVHVWITEFSLIRRMNIRDLFGTITVLNFSDIEVDKLIGTDEKTLQSLFSFIPPEDTEIIEQ
jgi:outer membrane lipoprotein carrier protein